MVQNVMRDQMFLSQKSDPATKEDMQVAADLRDTLQANNKTCVGMAANMIVGNARRILMKMISNTSLLILWNLLEISKNF